VAAKWVELQREVIVKSENNDVPGWPSLTDSEVKRKEPSSMSDMVLTV